MKRSPSWELFASFLAVMDSGSLLSAARRLGVTQPTARRRVEELEQALGVRLFTRSHAGLAPTEAAAAILPYAQTLRSTVEALVRMATAETDGVAGSVRVTASEVVAAHVLPNMLAAIIAAHGGLAIELAGSNRVENLMTRQADIAVRMVRPQQAGLVARKVGEVTLGLFATPGYIARHGKVCAATLGEQVFVGQDRKTEQLAALQACGVDTASLRFAFRSDSDVAQLGAIAAGIGIGVCHATGLAHRLGFERVLPDLEMRLEMWLATHADLRAQPRIRVVMDGLANQLREYCRSA